MRLRSIVGAFLVLWGACVCASATDPGVAPAEDLRKQIAELQRDVARLNNRLDAIERRLSRLEKPAGATAPARGDRFPEAVERAMMIEAWELNRLMPAPDEPTIRGGRIIQRRVERLPNSAPQKQSTEGGSVPRQEQPKPSP